MTVVTMSKKELGRLEALVTLEAGRTTAAQAASLIGVSERQVFRLLKTYRALGPAGLASRRRGRPSNRRYGDAIREAALAVIRERYADFGPTLAAEKLAEIHDLRLGRETVRRWMVAAGLWVPRKDRHARVHQPRHRRDRLGELVQVDGCEHHWLEDRGPPCTLLVFVDDATSRLMHLRFVESESTFSYLRAARSYVEAHGRPVALYSDKHTVFRVAGTGRQDGETQFGRAMRELNVEVICADSPQAKGRVERAHKTLQDRLVKELRLASIATVEAANAFLPAFVAGYNGRFAKPAHRPEDLHRPAPDAADLDEIMAVREERSVSASLTLRYDKMLILLEPNEVTRPLARKRVTVVNYPDGRFAIRHRGLDLPFRVFDKLRKVDQGAIIENGRLGAVLARIRERQAAYEPAWNRDLRPATRNNLRRAAEGSGLTSLTGADP
jgi:Winged helix-turn helix